MIGYGLLMAVLVILYFTVPAAHLTFVAGMGLATVAAVGFGVVHHRPRRRSPWIIVAAAIAAFVTGDVINMYLTDVQGVADPFPSLGDAFYLAVYPLLGFGLIGLLRSGAAVRDRASLLDALTLTCGVGLLSWIFLINPLITTPDLTLVERVIAVAYPLCDVLLVTVLIRMTTAFRPSRSVALLTGGLGLLLMGDVVYGAQQLNNAYQLGGVSDSVYMLFYATVGAAAIHPSMVGLTEPRVLRPTQASRGRVVVLGAASLIPPAVLLTEAFTGEVRDAVMIGILCAVLFGLVVARLSGVVTVHRLMVKREMGLRRAGAAMLGATSVEEVTASVRAAIADLLPPNTAHHVVISVTESATDADPDPVPEMRIVPTRTLGLDPRDDLASFELLLRCTLPGRRISGHLDVGADDTALVALQEAAQVLAAQAVLALDGLAANAEIVRRESEVYFRTLVLNATDVIMILDDDDRVRYASPSAETIFGSTDIVGVPLLDLIDPRYQEGAAATLDAARAGRSAPDLTDWTVRAGSRQVQVEASCRDLRHEPTVAGVVITLRDVTEHRRLERELLHRAYYDSLTGLPNRALFTERLERAVAAVTGTRTTAGVLLIGLDNFKVINDTMGYDIGDELLAAVGQRIVAAVTPHHGVARMGGDEFGVLVEAVDGPHAFERLGERIVATFEEPFPLTSGSVVCHASVGLVTTAEAADGAELLGRADVALAMAKGGGKGRWCRYEATLHTRILERLQLHTALDQAISNGEFLLAYQPVVDLVSGRTEGFEALIRWQHPTRGVVPPLDFIDIAEDSGLIVQVGQWVLRTAIAAARTWRELARDRPPYVAVNVSPRQFHSPGFVELVMAELAASGLPATSLIIEITESLLLNDKDQERIRADLDALRAAGVRIAIDDFGTGYSSLSYLHRVPVDIVKLDKSFVDTITTSPSQYELVKGIVRLAHTLQLAVVAEGIETSNDLDLLVDTTCEYGQGYLFARPMGELDAQTWLLEHVPTA